jgi:RNA polymerase sigma factor (TIGR02999 family)
MHEVTQILNAIDEGDRQAAEQLLPLVYDELRQLASIKLAAERRGQTLSATALVHEAYLRLVGPENDAHFQNGRHFYSAAAEAMRRILVDAARRKKRQKHGGDRRRVDLCDGDLAVSPESYDDLVALDCALTKLVGEDPTAAELVKLHFFGALSIEQAGEMLGLSRATAYRNWDFARAWLRCTIDESDGE